MRRAAAVLNGLVATREFSRLSADRCLLLFKLFTDGVPRKFE